MKKPLVVLDPGHGGFDVGFRSGSLVEKDINLAVCLELWNQLWGSGVQVLMTRETDESKSAEERAAYANEQGADLFVSWHCDLLADEHVSGLSVWIHEEHADGRHMQDCEHIGDRISRDTGQLMLGVFQERDRVLEKVLAPSMVIHGAFLSNPTERRLCANPEFIKLQALGAAKGIIEMLRMMSRVA